LIKKIFDFVPSTTVLNIN